MKKGQVTIFIILGIIILATVMIFFYVKSNFYFGPVSQERLQQEIPAIKEHIETCLEESTEPLLKKIGLQGGILEATEDTYDYYLGDKISYLCYDIPRDKRCSNRVLLKSDMEKELENNIKKNLAACIDVKSFEKSGYDIVEPTTLDLRVAIGQDSVITFLTYPIVIRKGDLEIRESAFKNEIKYPLGRLFNSARDIITAESIIGNFDSTLYSFMKTKNTNVPYIIQKLQPYPDKLYILKIKDIPSERDPYIFQFLIQGEQE